MAPRYRLLMLLICAGLTVRPAAAQTADDESVSHRSRPDFSPDGIALPDLLDGATRLVSASARQTPRDDAGSDLLLLPTLETAVIADSNALRTESHHGDFAARISSGLYLASEDEVSGWSLAAHEDSTRYLMFSSLNGDQTSFRQAGFWVPTEDVRIDLGVSEQWRGEPLEDSGTGFRQQIPNRYVQYVGQATASFINDDWQVTAREQATAYRFARNPPFIVGNELDRQEFLSTLHVANSLFDGAALFVEPSINLRQYSREVSTDGLRHNSSGGQMLAGIRYDVSSVTYVEAGAGWLRQEYADSAFATVSGPALDGRAVWNPLDQMSLTLTATRRIAESELPGTAGVETTAQGAAADYEILDNLLAGCSFSYTDMQYRSVSGQSSRIDEITQYGVELRYLIDRNFSLAASWTDYQRSSTLTGAALSFERLSLRAGAMVRGPLLVLALAALLAACGINAIDLPPPPPAPAGDYRVDSGDKVSLQVFGQSDMSGQFDIGADGTLTLPLIGRLPVRGLTVQDVAAKAGERYAKLMVDPKVTADIVAYRAIYVLGEVNRAGNFPYSPGLRVQQAIAIAGGFTRRAVTDRIVLVRTTEKGQARYAVGLSDEIQPGDTLDVQRRVF